MYSTVRKQALYHETGMSKLGGRGGNCDRKNNPFSSNGEDYAPHITSCPLIPPTDFQIFLRPCKGRLLQPQNYVSRVGTHSAGYGFMTKA